jgi:hypothetical protein
MYRGEPVVVYNLYGQFEEIAALVSDTLQRGGHAVIRSRTILPGDHRLYVLFGANVWTDLALLPMRYVIMQLEQSPIRKWFIPQYFARLAAAEQVWDYNLANIEYLRSKGISAYHVPIGYSPLFDPAPPAAEAIDLLFLGQLRNEHREEVLRRLRAEGFQVVAANDVFGEAKKRLVAQAKVVLNLHYGYTALLEEARLIPLLAAGKVVVSETVTDPRYVSLYQGFVDFAQDTNHLITLCRAWLQKSASERQAHGEMVRKWVTTQRQAQQLFPWGQIEEEYPSVARFSSISEIPPEVTLALIPRSYHLFAGDWRPVRHYGDLTLMRRV